MARKSYHSIVEDIRIEYPEKLHVWSINQLIVQAGLRGLSISVQLVVNHIRRGVGPEVLGTAGNTVLIDPEDGVRWINAMLAKRGNVNGVGPSGIQVKKGVTAESFASI
jgi:hypothetical protein